MFAGERRDPSKGVKGLDTEFPEDNNRSPSKEETPVSYNSPKENAYVVWEGCKAEVILLSWGV